MVSPVENHGTVTTDGTEQTLFDVTPANPTNYETFIFLSAIMVAGDTVTIRQYVKDVQGAAMKLYQTFSYSGVQSVPAILLLWVINVEYKVTIQRTAGVDRTHTWSRYDA